MVKVTATHLIWENTQVHMPVFAVAFDTNRKWFNRYSYANGFDWCAYTNYVHSKFLYPIKVNDMSDTKIQKVKNALQKFDLNLKFNFKTWIFHFYSFGFISMKRIMIEWKNKINWHKIVNYYDKLKDTHYNTHFPNLV